jgi:hypothetical protein
MRAPNSGDCDALVTHSVEVVVLFVRQERADVNVPFRLFCFVVFAVNYRDKPVAVPPNVEDHLT